MNKSILKTENQLIEVALRLEMIHAYDEVSENLELFKDAILSDRDLPGWVFRTEQETKDCVDHREKAVWVAGLTTYLDNQEPKEAITCPGLLGASETTIKIALQLNLAKNRFKDAMLALKGYKITAAEPYLRELDNPVSLTSEALRNANLARLHLKQMYRNIPILDEKPIRIGFTWANTRSIKKVNKEEAEIMLRRLSDDSRIIQQIQMLSHLAPDELIAIVHDTATHVRANILWHESHTPRTKMTGCPLPILIPMSIGELLPAFTPVGEKKDRLTRNKRKSRTDHKLEAKSFLPAIHAFRYTGSNIE